ncbi:unnamed protein product [Rhodiola kirilowii]
MAAAFLQLFLFYRKCCSWQLYFSLVFRRPPPSPVGFGEVQIHDKLNSLSSLSMAEEKEAAEYHQTLLKLKSIEPHHWLTPSPSLSKLARISAQQLFSVLKPYAPKSPFDKLLVDGFDAEQIWQQIDMQSQTILATLRREVKRYESNLDEIAKLFGDRGAAKQDEKSVKGKDSVLEKGIEDVDEDMKEEESETQSDDEEEKEETGGKKEGIEDEFLDLNEMQEYMDKDEEREYGVSKKKNKNVKHKDDSSEDELDLFGGGVDIDDDELGDLKYNDFFGSSKKMEVKQKFDLMDGSEDSETEDDEEEEEDREMKKEKLSTFQKEELKRQAQIAQQEKSMLEPKTWAHRGEVTAAQRPKNSALEVDLDFERNVRPAPIITEEVTLSLEDMIKKRILEGRFDDVQKPPGLPTKAPRERKELDETKSKKGLGEIYEDEYVQKTNPDAAPICSSDELKKEAGMLFKKICLQLDALSHFHFAPKPVIEEMSIQSNLPAIAMEEVAPLAVSDATMLAPEEIYDGKGDFKEEGELTQAERKRRRANKKRKFKAVAAKQPQKKAKEDTLDGKEAS